MSHPVATVTIVADDNLLPRRERIVLAMLQDGRQLEGELQLMSGRYSVGGVLFDAWELEELEDVT
jgi:hypothetical protein